MNTQYLVVFIILALTVGWIIYKLVFKKDKGSGGCCGCALSEKCSKPEKGRKRSDKSC
ncbi:MAG: FeoB-associated Cys-rich membrane protein [Muribaculaceae bacterium]|nr:FeoB-associated Cys-rich membrane protein [Muribaculaceae bacterium]